MVNGYEGGNDDLGDIKYDDSDRRKVKGHFSDDAFPTWSPDGTQVLCSSTRQGDGVSRPYVGKDRVRTTLVIDIIGTYSIWLPTGEMAFSGCDCGWGSDSRSGTYADWAGQLDEQGQFSQAIEKYEAILKGYAETPAGAEAAELAAGTYADWAAQLHEEGQFSQAIEKYQAVLTDYPDTPAGAQAAGLAAETYANWAGQLREKGDYEAAVANYQEIVDQYPGTTAAKEVPAQAAEKYQTILDQYPNSEPATEVRESLAGTLYEWAEELWAKRDYPAAVEHYWTILSDFSASQVISQAVEGLAWTTYDWGKSLQAQHEYSGAMDRYEEILADPRLSAVVTTTVDVALDMGLAWTEELSATKDYVGAAAAGLRTQAVAGQERMEQANSLLARVYWAWGNSYAAAKSYSTAIDKHNLVLNDAALKPYAPGVAEAAAAAYYAWGQSQGTTDSALSTYATLRQRFPKLKWASQAAEAAASIYVGRADAEHKAGKYADAISAYEKVIRDYPNTRAAGQARTRLNEAEAAWRRSLADKLLAAIATAQKGADELSEIYTTLSRLFGSVLCSKIRGVAFGDTKLTIPDRFSSLQTAYRNHRDALSLLEAAKKILTDKCPGTATSSMLSSGKDKINSAKSKLSQAKQAAEAAR